MCWEFAWFLCEMVLIIRAVSQSKLFNFRWKKLKQSYLEFAERPSIESVFHCFVFLSIHLGELRALNCWHIKPFLLHNTRLLSRIWCRNFSQFLFLTAKRTEQKKIHSSFKVMTHAKINRKRFYNLESICVRFPCWVRVANGREQKVDPLIFIKAFNFKITFEHNIYYYLLFRIDSICV